MISAVEPGLLHLARGVDLHQDSGAGIPPGDGLGQRRPVHRLPQVHHSGQELDLRCPGAQVLSHRGLDLVAAIGNERHAQKFTDQRLAAEPARPFGQRPEVAVAGVCEIIAPLG